MKFIDIADVAVRMLEPVDMVDGTSLSADVYLPPGEQPRPVLLTFTPYDNNRASRPRADGRPAGEAPFRRWQRLAAAGYVVVAVDVRGRGDSQGTFVPFATDATDGATCVRWARSLPECDGRVGLFGAGYAGWAALAAAVESGEVDALNVHGPFGAPEQGMPFSGGALRLDWLFWMHLVGGRTTQPVSLPPWAKIWSDRPLLFLDASLGRTDVWWREWLTDPGASMSEVARVHSRVAELDCPTRLTTGWWDQNLPAARQWWSGLTSEPNSKRREIVVGPWDTRAVRHPRADSGGISWGPASVLDVEQELLTWFGDQFGPEPRTGRSARTFVTGVNEWYDEPEWTPHGDRLEFWLSSTGPANTRRGGGKLSTVVSDSGGDCFVHNPANPVRWQTSTPSFDAHPDSVLRLDNDHITSRDDSLVYRTDSFATATRLVGSPKLTLHAETDCDDSDWIALLADVFPGGLRTVVISHGVVRAQTSGEFGPNRVVKYSLDMDEVGHVVLPGHALELTIISSLFPLYAPNFGAPDYLRAVEPRLGTQRVFHGVDHPSVLQLQTADCRPG